MQKLFITCGVIGSGKSTWAKNKYAYTNNIIILSKDDIRYSFNGGKYIFDNSHEIIISEMMKVAVKTALHNNFNIIIDEANITYEKRKIIYDIVYEYCSETSNDVEVIIVCFNNYNNNIKNRMNNSRGMTENEWTQIYHNMLKSFEIPTKQEIPFSKGNIIYI